MGPRFFVGVGSGFRIALRSVLGQWREARYDATLS